MASDLVYVVEKTETTDRGFVRAWFKYPQPMTPEKARLTVDFQENWLIDEGLPSGVHLIVTPSEIPGIMEYTDDTGTNRPVLMVQGGRSVEAYVHLILSLWGIPE